jgi:predicted nuclease of restriction endonuclease-like (RecB) superfamily
MFFLPAVPKLERTHYRLLVRVENEAVRNWYVAESDAESFSTRALERQPNSFCYERLLSSQDEKPEVILDLNSAGRIFLLAN